VSCAEAADALAALAHPANSDFRLILDGRAHV
jgi:hypothetical protein